MTPKSEKPGGAQCADALATTDLTLRRMIGLLGTLLPFVLLFGGYLSHPPVLMRKSISAYYYTEVGYLFVGVMLATGAFLVCYRGYSVPRVGSQCRLCTLLRKWCPCIRDDGLTSVAGLLAILVAVLPATVHHQEPTLVNYAHWVFAAGFLLSTALMSHCQFTLGQDTKNHRLYRGCAWVILAAIIVILVDYLVGGPLKRMVPTIVWWLETLAVSAFGLSWLVKSQMMRTPRRQGMVGLALLVLFLLAFAVVP